MSENLASRLMSMLSYLFRYADEICRAPCAREAAEPACRLLYSVLECDGCAVACREYGRIRWRRR